MITTTNAVDLRGRPRPNPLQSAKTSFAEKCRRTSFLENLPIAIDRKLAPRFALPIFQRRNPIIKAGDRDPSFAIVQSGEQLRQRRGRIGHRASENAGVQIHLRSGHFHFERGDSAQSVAQGWRSAL